MIQMLHGLWLQKGVISLKAFAFLYAINAPHGLPHGAVVKCYGTVRYTTPTQAARVGSIMLYKFTDAPVGFYVSLNLPAQNIWCMSNRDLGKQKVLVYGAW